MATNLAPRHLRLLWRWDGLKRAASLTNFGMVCVRLNRPIEALTSFEQALKVNPEYVPAQRGKDLLKTSP